MLLGAGLFVGTYGTLWSVAALTLARNAADPVFGFSGADVLSFGGPALVAWWVAYYRLVVLGTRQAYADFSILSSSTLRVRRWSGSSGPFALDRFLDIGLQRHDDDRRGREDGATPDAEDMVRAAGMLEAWRARHLGSPWIGQMDTRRLRAMSDRLDEELGTARKRWEEFMGYDPFGYGDDDRRQSVGGQP
jgi:hypothetical protein